MKKKLGFALLQTVLLFVLLATIIGTGYYVWQNRAIENNNSDSQTVGSYQQCIDAQGLTDELPEKCTDGDNVYEYPAEIIDDDYNTWVKFSDVEESLQQAVKATYAKEAPDCQFTEKQAEHYVNEDKIISKYKVQNAATVGIGCDGGAVALFVYTGKSWITASSTQTGFDCKLIDQYKVSKDVVVYCIEEDGSDRSVSYE